MTTDYLSKLNLSDFDDNKPFLEKTDYNLQDCAAIFTATNSTIGFDGFHNMCRDFPLNVFGIPYKTAEAVFQAAKFPDNPEIQEKIRREKSPMIAKEVAYKPENMKYLRNDWDVIKIDVMFWVLRMKHIQHHRIMKRIFQESRDRDVVEASYKGDYWGALVYYKNGQIRAKGFNVLGKLWTAIRNNPGNYTVLESPDYYELKFDGYRMNERMMLSEDNSLF